MTTGESAILASFAIVLVACDGDGKRKSEPAESAEDAAIDSAVGDEHLDLLSFYSGGSACFGECWRRFTVRAPAVLELEDSEGTIRYDISETEFAAVENLALSPGFREVVSASLDETACGGHDINLSMTYRILGDEVVDVPSVDNCAIGDGVLARIYSQIDDLTEQYLICPPWAEPPGFELATTPLPQRPLCWFCYGRCHGEEQE